MRKLISYVLCSTVIVTILSGSASATRMRYVKEQQSDSVQTQQTEPEIEKVDYGSIMYVDGLPGPDDFDWSRYLPEGSEATIPNFNLYTEFKEEQITSFSDAVVDFLGWDASLGTASYDLADDTFIFKPIAGITGGTNFVTGYGKKKFGSGKHEFKVKMDADDGVYDSWLGISFLCQASQAMQWESNQGYLLCIKEDVIEVQKWFPIQEMVATFPNEKMTLGEWHDFCLDLNATDTATEIALIIDGEEAFRYVDTDTEAVPKEGYINFYCGEDKISVKAVNPTIRQENQGMVTDDGASVSGNASLVAFKEGIAVAYAGGEYVPIDEANPAVCPIMENDRMLIPLRFLSEKSGYRVSWDDELQTASVIYGGRVLEITPGFAEYRLDGVTYKLDVTPQKYHDRVFVPARVVSEALGKKVLWENETVWIYDGEEPTAEEKNTITDGLK